MKQVRHQTYWKHNPTSVTDSWRQASSEIWIKIQTLYLDLHVVLSMQATFHSIVVSNVLKLDIVVPTQATSVILNVIRHFSCPPAATQEG